MNKINRVLVVGGTHGNEKTGIYLVDQKWPTTTPFKKLSFAVETIIGNPKASDRCIRYVDQDLNRCFASEDLSSQQTDQYEVTRAQSIKADFGREGTFVIDMHTTTTNMGRTVVILHESKLTNSLIFHLQKMHPDIKIIKTHDYGERGIFLNQITNEGFLIEVGPVPQGVINAQIVSQTEELVVSGLNILSDLQSGKALLIEGVLETYTIFDNIDFPRDKAGSICGVIHPDLDGKDFMQLSAGNNLFILNSGEIIKYEGETCYPIFVNEAAYYEKGIAMQLTRKEKTNIG